MGDVRRQNISQTNKISLLNPRLDSRLGKDFVTCCGPKMGGRSRRKKISDVFTYLSYYYYSFFPASVSIRSDTNEEEEEGGEGEEGDVRRGRTAWWEVRREGRGGRVAREDITAAPKCPTSLIVGHNGQIPAGHYSSAVHAC